MSERDQAEPVDLTDPSSDKEEEPVVDPTEYTVTRNGLELDETMAEITGEMWQGASALVRQSAQLQRQQNLTASAVAMVIRLNGRCGREKRRGRLRWRCRNRASDGDPLGHCSSCRSTTGASKAFPLRNFRRSRAAQQLETRRLYSEHYRKRSTVLIAQKPANVAKPLASPRSRGKRGKAIEQAKKAPKKASPTGKPSGRPSSSSSDEDLDINDVDLSGFDIRDGEDPEVAEASDDSDDDAFMEDV
mmetsp:Transcript_678/g.2404  ORF Transcript_678/g.2404 Transcript_678/m.2404 type:complete len:246 (+) Transcript_678:95-832(+)